MRFFLIILLLSVIAFLLFFSPVNKERACYATSKVKLSDIDYDILSRGISKSMQCERSVDVLYTLESCIQDATKSSMVAGYANDMILRIVAILRPYEHSLWTIKADHNDTCAEYSRYQLP